MERKECGQAGHGQGSVGKVKDMTSTGSAGQGRGRPRIRPFLQTAARRMAGGFTVGQDVLVRYNDGLFYEGRVLRVDEGNDRCQVQFEDKSTYYVLFKDIHSGPAEGEISCCICQGETSEAPNEIVLCDNCGMGYHQLCHNPPIHSSVLQPHVDFFCKLCTFAARVKHGGSSGKVKMVQMYELTHVGRATQDQRGTVLLLLRWTRRVDVAVVASGFMKLVCAVYTNPCCMEIVFACLSVHIAIMDRSISGAFHSNGSMLHTLPLFNLTLQFSHKYYDLDEILMPWIANQADNLQIDSLLDVSVARFVSCCGLATG
ncbi:hypothetical protein BaRGS_00021465 [Batillaria attramentaria]|uniref:PHD-type domain-containing protein n=1 Tax=Batillaria attramentaria TaxID=370345 RepID=A0ABD0KJP4_9CAEN